jgi:potassium-transporting ATPase KdpC subunit
MREIVLGALRLSLVTLALCGLVYPLAVTALGQWLLPWQANGSLRTDASGEIVGSPLIGQQWNGPEWFHGRPSATTAADPQHPGETVPAPYNAAGSGGSNLGPASKALFDRLQADRAALEQAQPELRQRLLPSDLLTTSGSGLDPEISPANAALQVVRVARTRGVPASDIQALVEKHTIARTVGIFGEPRVNVFELNMDLKEQYLKQ